MLDYTSDASESSARRHTRVARESRSNGLNSTFQTIDESRPNSQLNIQLNSARDRDDTSFVGPRSIRIDLGRRFLPPRG
jgi:hypothetical protein